MKTLVAALLIVASPLASALCYVSPISGVTYCYSAQECPAATIWNPSSQACLPFPSQPVPGTDSPHTPPAVCVARIEYQYAHPVRASLANASPHPSLYFPVTPGCDVEGLRLALAAALAQLLGAPPHP